MAPCLLELPNELIDHIILNFLDKSDLLSLRAVCKPLCNRTYYEFGRKYFDKVKTDLSQPSIQRLKDIAKVQELRPFIRTLCLVQSTDAIHTQESDQESCEVIQTPLPRNSDLQYILLQEWTNCSSFMIRFSDEDFQNSLSSYNFAVDTIGRILPLIQSESLQVKSLSIVFKNYSGHYLMGSALSDLHPYQPPTLETSSKNRSKLNLNFYIVDFTLMTMMNNLFEQAQDLDTLSLNLDMNHFWERDMGLDSLNFPRLRVLQIDRIHIVVEMMLRFLQRFSRTLQSLSMRLVDLQCHKDWQFFFAGIGKTLPRLNDLLLEGATEVNSTFLMMFLPHGSPDSCNYDGFELSYLTSDKRGMRVRWRGKESEMPVAMERFGNAIAYDSPTKQWFESGSLRPLRMCRRR